MARLGLDRPELRAWAMYDWAASAVQPTLMVAVVPIYFVKVAGAELPASSATQRLATVNLSTGRDPSKLRWNPEEVVFTSAVQLSPTRRARMVFHTYHDVLRLRRESQFGKLLGVASR